MAERLAPAKFPEADGLPLGLRDSSSFEKQQGGGRRALGQLKQRGCRREAPVARIRRDGKRKAPGIYNQNVGWQ